MTERSFKIDEFIEKTADEPEEEVRETDGSDQELDVQKAVVEELAAEKVKMEKDMDALKERLASNEKSFASLAETLAAKEKEAENLAGKVEFLQKELDRKNAELEKSQEELAKLSEREYDMQERNPNALALLDRDEELPDRFPGETRDHVIEAVKEARDKAEAEGRKRRAQLLEGVLVYNEPNGTLAQRREKLKEVFEKSGNIVNGEAIEYLQDQGLTHKNGEDYMSAAEIVKFYY